MAHYLRRDLRIGILNEIILPFQIQLEKVREKCKNDEGIYWDSIYADDVEHIVGTAFIVFQNYINSSISDLYPSLKKLYEIYLSDKNIGHSNTTRIELIISIANYYKHRDLPDEIHKNTSKPFNDLGIEYKEFFSKKNNKHYNKIGSESPVFTGLSILSEEWDLNELIIIVSKWRENLWIEKEKNDNLK